MVLLFISIYTGVWGAEKFSTISMLSMEYFYMFSNQHGHFFIRMAGKVYGQIRLGIKQNISLFFKFQTWYQSCCLLFDILVAISSTIKCLSHDIFSTPLIKRAWQGYWEWCTQCCLTDTISETHTYIEIYGQTNGQPDISNGGCMHGQRNSNRPVNSPRLLTLTYLINYDVIWLMQMLV